MTTRVGGSAPGMPSSRRRRVTLMNAGFPCVSVSRPKASTASVMTRALARSDADWDVSATIDGRNGSSYAYARRERSRIGWRATKTWSFVPLPFFASVVPGCALLTSDLRRPPAAAIRGSNAWRTSPMGNWTR